MYETLNKPDTKRLAGLIFLIVLAIVVFAAVWFNLFGFADFLEDGGLKPARVYVGGFCAFVGIVPLFGLRSALADTPLKSLQKYARTTQDPDAALKRLLETWERGRRLGRRCRMDDAYVIAFVSGVYAQVVPIAEVVWAYKTVARANFVKVHTSLEVRYADRKPGSLPLGEAVIDSVLEQFMEQHRDIAVGHSSHVERLYRQKDLAGLKEYARQQRAGVSS